MWHHESGGSEGSCDALAGRRSGDCFACAAWNAGSAGASPFDLTTVGVAGSHDFACRRQYWRPRERARTRRVAEDGAVLARAVAAGACPQSVSERLADAPRSGAPATYTPEQICAVIAMTCEKPSESERPISHWSRREIADEAIRRGLVSNISQRSVGRFLKKRPTLNRTAFVTG